MPVTGLSTAQYNNYLDAARRLISTYDRNGDGRVNGNETQQRVDLGSDSYFFDSRVSNDYVERTTVFQETYGQANSAQFAAVDGGGDDAIVQAYLRRADSNGDGKLGFWEKLKMSTGAMRNMFESRTTVETDRETHLVFDPAPYYPPTPLPPRPSFRPEPPSVRPTPPSPTGRPTPPSVGPSRPTPPRVN